MKVSGRTWFIFLLLTMLAGCTWVQQFGGGAPLDQPTPTAKPSPTPVPEATPTRTFSMTSRPMTLKLWVPEFLDPYRDTAGGTALTAQLAAFSTANDKIQVEVIAKMDTGPGGLLNLLSTAVDVAPSIMPDVIVLNKADLRVAANAGLVQPLVDVTVSWSDFYPFALASVDVTNPVYGMPFVANADQMVYREGVSDTPPISWTAVVTHGYAMLFPAGSPTGLADDALLSAYMGSGGSVIDQDGKATLDRVYLEQLYGFFFELIRLGLINSERALSLPDAKTAWQTYNEGIGDLSPVPVGLYWQNLPQGSRPIWMPNAQGKPLAIVRNWSLAMVTVDPSRQRASQELIAWLVDPQYMSELTRSALLIPTRRHAVRLWGLFPEDRVFLDTLLENGTSALPSEIDTAVRRALQFGLIAVLSQEVDTPEAAATYAMTNLRR